MGILFKDISVTAKEARKIIGCGPQFIPAITKKFYGHDRPIFGPTHKGSQGQTSKFTHKDLFLLATMYECRFLGLDRSWIDIFKRIIVIKNGVAPISITLFNSKYYSYSMIRLRLNENKNNDIFIKKENNILMIEDNKILYRRFVKNSTTELNINFLKINNNIKRALKKEKGL